MKVRALVVAIIALVVGGGALGLAIAEVKSTTPVATPADPAPAANSVTTGEVPAPATKPSGKPAARAAAKQAATKLSPAELDQLLAPVALYPDQLLDQVLMASTYPLEVVEAARWVKAPAHRHLKGRALMRALKARNWAPSVMALVPFPRLLETMNEKIRWTEDLGNAFLAQQADVMAAVQRLRRQALAAGNLDTARCRCRVERRSAAIAIAPVDPAAVYVPVYNPMVAYGPWPYPLYPPVVFPIPIGFVWAPVPFIGFYPVVTVAFYGPLWGWADFDWRDDDILVDVAQYDALTFGDPAFGGAVWVHDSAHRDGVAYADPAVRARFGDRAAAAARGDARSAGLASRRSLRHGWHEGASGSFHGHGLRSGRYHAALGGWHHSGGHHGHIFRSHRYHAALSGWHHGGGFHAHAFQGSHYYHGGRGAFAMGGGFHGGGYHGGGFHGGGFHGGGGGHAGGHGGHG